MMNWNNYAHNKRMQSDKVPPTRVIGGWDVSPLRGRKQTLIRKFWGLLLRNCCR